MIEVTKLRLTALGHLPGFALPAIPPAEGPLRPRTIRRIFPDPEAGWREVPIYAGSDLYPGHALDGQAVIEETTTTVLVGPHDRLRVDDTGNYGIDLLPRPG